MAAPHIGAADALAAAVSHGDVSGKSTKRTPQGKKLSNMVEVFDIDEPRAELQPQLQVRVGRACNHTCDARISGICYLVPGEHGDLTAPSRSTLWQSCW